MPRALSGFKQGWKSLIAPPDFHHPYDTPSHPRLVTETEAVAQTSGSSGPAISSRMASLLSSQVRPAAISTRDLMAMDMATLVRKIKEGRKNSNGDIEIDTLDDWSLLSQKERADLGERLRDAAAQAGGRISPRHPNDEDFPSGLAAGVMERLGQYDGTTASWSLRKVSEEPANERAPTPFLTREDILINSEVAYYNSLVKDGGRPPVPLDRISSVVTEPALHYDLIRSWASDPDNPDRDDVRMTETERQYWREFRDWQQDNRRVRSDEEIYNAFVNQKGESMLISGWPELEVQKYMAYWEEEMRNKCQSQRPRTEWQCADGIEAHNEATERRLAKHGLAKPVSFLEDPNMQSPSTTWLERLAFQCWYLDYDTLKVHNRQPKYDRNRELLLEANILRPSELPEQVRTLASRRERDIELDAAWDAVDMATGDPTQLAKAESVLNDVQRRKTLLDKFENDTYYYWESRRGLRRNELVLQWVKDQLSLVEMEEQSKAQESGPHSKPADDVKSQVGMKRKRQDADDVDEAAVPAATRRKIKTKAEPGHCEQNNPPTANIESTQVDENSAGPGADNSNNRPRTASAHKRAKTTTSSKSVSKSAIAATSESWAKRLRPRPLSKASQPSKRRRSQTSKTLAAKVTKVRRCRQ